MINIRDFVYIEKRFLDKGDHLKIYTALDRATPFDIYINNELYGLQVSLQPDIPHTINNSNFNIGYNEIKVGNIVFGITKGYDNESNIISIDNCNYDNNNLYIYGGESKISIDKNENIDMNSVLNIHNILGNSIITRTINKSLLGNKSSNKLYYNNLINNVQSVNRVGNKIDDYKYFRVEFDTTINSTLTHLTCIDENNNSFSIENDYVFIVQDHNFLNTDPVSFILYHDDTSDEIDIDITKPYGFIEFISEVSIAGFILSYYDLPNFKVYGKVNNNDEYSLIFKNDCIGNFDYMVNLLEPNYISALKIGDDIYTLGTNGDIVVNNSVIDFDDSLSYHIPMSDTNIMLEISGDIDDIILYNNIESLNLKEDEIEYGIIAEIDNKYIDSSGLLDSDIYVHKFNNIDLSLFPSNATISYYISSIFPAVVQMNTSPVISYYITNNISIDNYELTSDTIHDEYTLLKILISNEYQLKTYIDIYLNNNLSDSVFIDNQFSIQKAYNYGSDYIKLGSNVFKTIITDTLGNQLIPTNINLQYNNTGPSITYIINDFDVEITISDNDEDKVAYEVLINDELVSYNKKYRPTPYTDIFEWDNFKYTKNNNINLSIIATDELNESTTASNTIRIKDKCILVLDRLNRPIIDQFINQIVEIDIGTLISNIPASDPFIFKVVNQSGYDLYNLNISRNTEDNTNDSDDIIISFRMNIDGSYTDWTDNSIKHIGKFSKDETIIVQFKLDGYNLNQGIIDGKMRMNIYANIRKER